MWIELSILLQVDTVMACAQAEGIISSSEPPLGGLLG